jgi:predicted metal-dependent enzyme (double-stranded beta helix superfamily)
MTRAETRSNAVKQTVERIREIEKSQGIDRNSLENIKSELIALAKKTALFGLHGFSAPAAEDKDTSCLYRLSEDEDHRFALYLQVSDGAVSTPPHNHTTWAVIAGIQGRELNRFYQRQPDGGVEMVDSKTVEPGNAVAMLPDDLHSIHIDAGEPVVNFHMYGLGLEQLTKREYLDAKDKQWRYFKPHGDIRDACGN